jgi:hypothetical protein
MTKWIRCIDVIQVHFRSEIVSKDWCMAEALNRRVEIASVSIKRVNTREYE